MFHRQRLTILPAMLFVAVSAANASACPFCAAPTQTLAEQVETADAVVLVEWVKSNKSDGRLPGNTTVKIKKVAKGSKAALKPGATLFLRGYRPGKKGDLFLLMGQRADNVEWGAPLDVSQASYNYIIGAPSPKRPRVERLKYYLKYLEFPDTVVANDAYFEFANAPYKDIAKLAKALPRERIRKWINSADTPITRQGLHGLLLGLCGNKDDAALMKKKILKDSKEYRLGIEGVMSGYLLLAGETGLQVLEDSKLENDKVAFSETYAAMQALNFMWEFAPDRIKKRRLKESMRILLNRPTIADIVIAHLARWKDWDVQDRLLKLYDHKDYDIPAIKRAVVRFLLVCRKDFPAGTPPAKLPPHVRKAKANLERLRKKDPKTVKHAERFFYG
ncbi:MAG: hypothetical protein ACE5KM_01505 [Planctomycetaceae bacterium]